MAYLDREKMQARNLSPLDVMKALDNYNVFLPTGDAKFGDIDYAIDSNSMYQKIPSDMGDIPLRSESGRTLLPPGRGDPEGRAATSRPTWCGSTASGRSTSRSSASSAPARWRWSERSRNRLDGHRGPADAVGDQTQAGHGPVGLRAAVDRGLVQEGVLGAVLCSLVILLFLGQMADDGDRHHDAADLGPLGAASSCTTPGKRST